MKKPILALHLFILIQCANVHAQTATYTMPGEHELHEGTWLQWPHHYTYGTLYRDYLDQTFVDMTGALISGEKVFIIAYNNTEKTRIKNLLVSAGIPLTNIVFYIIKTNDVWVRDNGPVYVYNPANELTILDWNFNGWGNDAPYAKDNKVPQSISVKTGIPKVNISSVILEGGAVEIDGAGTFMATRSSIMGDGRNTGFTEEQLNDSLTKYLGVTNFVWLDGYYGGMLDITDTHIDGFARFLNSNTMVTMDEDALEYWGLSASDIFTLLNAQNADGVEYTKVNLSLTHKNVKTTWGANVGFKASYNNYYVGNTVVLATTFNDMNDDVALDIIASLYPDKTVIGIDSRNLYYFGGMIHCVTQQLPVAISEKYSSIVSESASEKIQLSVIPNPATEITNISFYLFEEENVALEFYTMQGEKIQTIQTPLLSKGLQAVQCDVQNLDEGNYLCLLRSNNGYSCSTIITVIK